jgi:kynureninase
VVVSARRPDALRLAVHPLTTRHVDLWDAVERLCAVLDDGRWRELAGAAR